ncbi:MAG: preprotein translocase subunit YajC [Kiritimatiellales bacterium]
MFMQWIALAAPPADGNQAQGGGIQFIGMMVLIFALMYFMMIRPQKRREKERRAMIAAVKAGSDVVLTSGIIGRVTNTKEKSLIIRTADDTKLEVLRSAVAQVLEDKGAVPEEVKA